jgi:hypothetical protein
MSENPPATRRRKRVGGYGFGTAVVIAVVALCILAVSLMLASSKQDTGIRVWVLNHAPDQVVIINPYNGQVESKFQVADGLKDMSFSQDFKKAYIGNVVDVTNKLTVIDTASYNKERTIEIDGVPQGIGVFPEDDKLAVITASKTNFMAGGFDVLDMNERSKADPTRQRRLYRERGLQLTHKIAVGDDGDRIYCLDAKEPLVHVFSFKQESWIKDIDLHGAPEELLYPPIGDYFYISVLQHRAIYQISKETDEIVGAFIYQLHDLDNPMRNGRLRHMALDSKAEHLVGTNYELKTVAIWRIGDPQFSVPWQDVPYNPNDEKTYRFEIDHFVPLTRFRLTGGYDPNDRYIPGGEQVVIDPLDDYLIVVDEKGAMYRYDFEEMLKVEDNSIPEPLGGQPVLSLTSDTTEIRDVKVSRPAVRLQ